jgi:VWFA-related protein
MRIVQKTETRRLQDSVPLVAILIIFLCAVGSLAIPGESQNKSVQQPADKAMQRPAATNSETQSVVKVRVPVVVVRVVVKDATGKIIENLRREDFELRDNNKPQEITGFVIEHPASRTLPNLNEAKQPANDEPGWRKADELAVPGRYVVLMLDDVHIRIEEALAVRNETTGLLHSLKGSELVAVYSTSGRIRQEFTTDQEALGRAVAKLMPAPMTGESGSECGHISYYQAQLMVGFSDPDATKTAIDDIWSCKYGKSSSSYGAAVSEAKQTSLGVYGMGDIEADAAVRRITEVVGRLSEMPGDRAIVFVSPGFASMELAGKLSGVLDKAIKSNVVVNTVDARGLFVPDERMQASSTGPCGDQACSPEVSSRFHTQMDQVGGEVLSSLANGTGGTWFRNRNDLGKSIVLAISAPPTSYVLTFSPANRNLDGKYHKLKVSLVNRNELTALARNGYFAAKPEADPEKSAEREFHDALFAQDEKNDFPTAVTTSFVMKDTSTANLSVVTHVDVQGIHFRKESGRNLNELTVGITIFDDHGNLVTGNKRTLTLKLQDETLERLLKTGFDVKMDFDVKPGTYVVREVSRESEDAKMSAKNGGVVIPK